VADTRRVIKALTPEGTPIALPVVVIGGEQQVAGKVPSLADALGAVEQFAEGFKNAVLKVAPSKATVEFGMTFALQSGVLTAMFVDGKAEGSVNVTLEWGGG
jgi:hypothetical protein